MKLKEEKGSITLFVVIAMFAFVLFSLATYTLLSRRSQTQRANAQQSFRHRKSATTLTECKQDRPHPYNECLVWMWQSGRC